jgi:cation-transporting ATPase 13A3/4/5
MSNPETSRKISEGGDADEEVLEIKKASLLLLGSKMLKSPFDEKCEYTALVKATGFSSVKGRLYRSMLHPPPSNSKMYNDSFKFIAVLFAASLLGVVYSVYVFISYGYEFWDIVIRAFDLIAAVVPQTLPATISIGIEFSLKRLKKRRIYCISPQKINLAGKVDLICFDKTGTLTEDTLTFYSVGLKQNDYSVALCNDRFSIYKKSEGSLVSQIMASCHSIREIDGKLIGDPLDLEMLDACGWTYEENSTILAENEIKNYLIGTCYPAGDSPSFFKKIDIIKRFDFTPEKKFMSVVAKMNKELYIFAKGAPEMILKMCTPHSFSKPIIHEIDAFAKKGFRVLCFAWKKIQSRVNPKKMNREKLESDLDFSGFILFENRLKAESESVVADLNECGIKSIISTGDNVYTAVYVSRECGMIDESDTILISSSSKSGKFIFAVSN